MNSYLKGLLSIVVFAPVLSLGADVNPFAVNNGPIPKEDVYSGPLFKFNYNYTTTYTKPSMPWRNVLNGNL